MKLMRRQRRDVFGDRHWTAGFTVALFFGCGAVVWAQRPMTIATGSPDGMYSELARAIAEQNPELAPVETLEELAAGEAHFAFAHQDIVSELSRDRPTNVRVVGRVFFDYLHIFVRDSVSIDTMSDLGRMRLWVGEPGTEN